MFATRRIPVKALVRGIKTRAGSSRQILATAPTRLQTQFLSQNARNSGLTLLRREEIRPSATLIGTAPWTRRKERQQIKLLSLPVQGISLYSILYVFATLKQYIMSSVNALRNIFTRSEEEYDWDIKKAREQALARLNALLPSQNGQSG